MVWWHFIFTTSPILVSTQTIMTKNALRIQSHKQGFPLPWYTVKWASFTKMFFWQEEKHLHNFGFKIYRIDWQNIIQYAEQLSLRGAGGTLNIHTHTHVFKNEFYQEDTFSCVFHHASGFAMAFFVQARASAVLTPRQIAMLIFCHIIHNYGHSRWVSEWVLCIRGTSFQQCNNNFNKNQHLLLLLLFYYLYF